MFQKLIDSKSIIIQESSEKTKKFPKSEKPKIQYQSTSTFSNSKVKIQRSQVNRPRSKSKSKIQSSEEKPSKSKEKPSKSKEKPPSPSKNQFRSSRPKKNRIDRILDEPPF